MTELNTYKMQKWMHSVRFEVTVPRKEAAADPSLRPRGHRNRLVNYIVTQYGDSQHTIVTGTT